MDDGRFDDADEGIVQQVHTLKIDKKPEPKVIYLIF